MSDSISRQDAIDAINIHFGFNIDEEYGSAVQEVINSLPSAERKGEWIEQVDCEGKTRRILCNLCNWKSGQYQWENLNYCPNCGAKMK